VGLPGTIFIETAYLRRTNMTFQDIINQMGIEMLVFAVCMYFGIRLVITRDISILYKEDPGKIKHPKEYTLYGGILILFFGVAALIMGIISFYNPVAAVISIVAAAVLLGVGWKYMHEKFA
jgi:hypothetical protein